MLLLQEIFQFIGRRGIRLNHTGSTRLYLSGREYITEMRRLYVHHQRTLLLVYNNLIGITLSDVFLELAVGHFLGTTIQQRTATAIKDKESQNNGNNQVQPCKAKLRIFGFLLLTHRII